LNEWAAPIGFPPRPTPRRPALPMRSVTLAALSLLSLSVVVPQRGSAQSADDFFEARVRPILSATCIDCHRDGRARGRLQVSTLADLLAGGRSGPAIVPGDPDASLLIRAVRHEVEELEMPQDAPPLSARDIEALEEWVRMGAPWPEESPAVTFAASVLPSTEGGLTPAAQLFVDRVRPVLEQKCYTCHTDEERGGLRLDSRERVLQGGGRGPAVIPGNPEQSLLIAALRHEDPDLQMPRNGAALTEAEIEGFVEWIAAGADWADAAGPLAVPRRVTTDEERAFWSFQPIADPTVPDGAGFDWARTDIDRFVMHRHVEEGVEPVGQADRRTLIRRATYDLIGLPPTPEEVEAFLADESSDAFGTVVERLLASPHYGERWGRHWLDVTRFGEDDTRGLANDGSGRERYPMAYVHRDWVVDAFNADMPYDTFAMAHLAADLMPTDDRQRLLPALGFLGQGPWYYDLADPPVARADERHDRVDVTSRGFLGLTVGCARCHDHKYDPIGTHDYYSFAGVFNNTQYHEYPLTDSAAAAGFENEKEFIEQLEKGLDTYMSTESDQLARVLTLQASDYMMAAWKVTGKDQIPADRAAGQARLDLETLDRWIDFLDDEPKHYPFLTDWQAMIADEGGTEEKAQELADAFQRLLLEVAAEQQKLEERNEKIIAKGTPLEEKKSVPMPNGFESFFDEHQLELETMDRERLNLYTDVFRYDLDNELDTFFPRPALLRFRGWSLERQLSRVAADHLAAMREEIEELEEGLPEIEIVMGVQDKDSTDIEDIGLHIRGSPLNLGERVPRSFLHVLEDSDAPPVYDEGSGRLQLARDIVSHPLAARVIVNRVWAWHMGSGIVRTPSNFGFAGAPPTHPELLEYLAARFVASGMSIKQLHRDIMASAVYQMASTDHEGNAAKDPENALLWRFNRQRLGAEGIRDALLAVSGELDRELGGPSMDLDAAENDRRTIYSEVSRFQPHIYLQTFDFPNPSLSAEQRFATNVPLQSLYFMNSPFVQRQAEALVRRLAEATKPAPVADAAEAGAGDGGSTPRPAPGRREGVISADSAEAADSIPASFDDRAMIEKAYPLLYGREVTEDEIALGLEFLSQQRVSWLARDEDDEDEDAGGETDEGAEASDDAGSGSVESGDDGSADESADDESAERAAADLRERRASMRAWTQYARALFSAVEFRFIH
jgi:hypothetical protein